MDIREYMMQNGKDGKVGFGLWITLPKPVYACRGVYAKQLWYEPHTDELKVWCERKSNLTWNSIQWEYASESLRNRIATVLKLN